MTETEFVNLIRSNYRYIYDASFREDFVNSVTDYQLKYILYILLDADSPSNNYPEYFKVFNVKLGNWEQLRDTTYTYIENNESLIQLRML
ncbi:hypothetical protein KAU11_09670 [Candidatus Babeliales bacterium]|nr:hypothetical protein [Candidatus Babeliales bacterium]